MDAVQKLVEKTGDLARRIARLEAAEPVASSGTSFPTNNLYTGRKFTRSDRNLEYYYDGTRWLSTTRFTTSLAARPAQVTGSNQPYPQGTIVWDFPLPDYNLNGIYLEKGWGWVLPNVGHSGTNYYTIKLSTYTTGMTLTDINPTTTNTQNATVGGFAQFYNYVLDFAGAGSPNNALGATNFMVFLTMAPVANPGSIYAAWSLSYRLIG